MTPHGYDAVVSYYGDPKFDGTTVDSKWEERNMIMARDLPLLTRSIYCHKYAEGPLRAALTACAALNDGYQIRKIGCFNPRWIRGTTDRVSMHTFGCAFDINPDTNALIIGCPEGDPRRLVPAASDIPLGWIALWEQAGFLWGGRFRSRFDPQHFQLATGC
jgi:hypothetical protein